MLPRDSAVFPPPSMDANDPHVATQLDRLSVRHALIVTDELNSDLILASRNLPKVDVLLAGEVDPVSLIAFDKVVITEAAVKKLGERLQ